MKFREVIDAFQNPNGDAGLVVKLLLGVSVLLTVVAIASSKWVVGLLALAFWGLFAYILKLGIEMARMDRRDNMFSAAATYVQQADTVEERMRRQGMLDTMGAAAVIAHVSQSETPRFNVDGTPMLQGMDVDLYGRPMGDTNDFLTNFDEPSVDVASGMPMSPDLSYEPPSGMNSSNM